MGGMSEIELKEKMEQIDKRLKSIEEKTIIDNQKPKKSYNFILAIFIIGLILLIIGTIWNSIIVFYEIEYVKTFKNYLSIHNFISSGLIFFGFIIICIDISIFLYYCQIPIKKRIAKIGFLISILGFFFSLILKTLSVIYHSITWYNYRIIDYKQEELLDGIKLAVKINITSYFVIMAIGILLLIIVILRYGHKKP
jgi:hypothetical protein